jgi:hypothetical protein
MPKKPVVSAVQIWLRAPNESSSSLAPTSQAGMSIIETRSSSIRLDASLLSRMASQSVADEADDSPSYPFPKAAIAFCGYRYLKQSSISAGGFSLTG